MSAVIVVSSGISRRLKVTASFFHESSSGIRSIVLVVFRLVTRNDWLAAICFICVFTYISSNAGDNIWTFSSIALLEVAIVVVALRVGLLALLVFNLIQAFLTRFPVTFDVSEWYFSIGLVGMIVPLAIAVFCFFLSLGDKSPLRMSSSQLES